MPVSRPATGLPTVAKVLPNRAAPGSWVTVYGRRLDSATSVSIFGRTAFEIVSPTMLRAQMPLLMFFVSPGPFIPMQVSVTNDIGTSVDTRYDDVAYLYDKSYTGPAVTSVTPATVSTERTSVIWLDGSNLTGVTNVTIGGQSAPFMVFKDRIAVQATPRAAGSYGIGLTAAAGTMPDRQISVRYEAPAAG